MSTQQERGGKLCTKPVFMRSVKVTLKISMIG